MRLLQQLVTSEEFTELVAFHDKYTFEPAVCYALGAVGASAAAGHGVQVTIEDFLPIPLVEDPEETKRKAEAAERSLDRGA